jgi:hypothetical protein
MKIYLVVTEEDGRTVRAPGVSETERKRMQYRFAANTMARVWDHIAWLRNDPELEIIGVYEEQPSITVLDDLEERSK